MVFRVYSIGRVLQRTNMSDVKTPMWTEREPQFHPRATRGKCYVI